MAIKASMTQASTESPRNRNPQRRIRKRERARVGRKLTLKHNKTLIHQMESKTQA